MCAPSVMTCLIVNAWPRHEYTRKKIYNILCVIVKKAFTEVLYLEGNVRHWWQTDIPVHFACREGIRTDPIYLGCFFLLLLLISKVRKMYRHADRKTERQMCCKQNLTCWQVTLNYENSGSAPPLINVLSRSSLAAHHSASASVPALCSVACLFCHNIIILCVPAAARSNLQQLPRSPTSARF